MEAIEKIKDLAKSTAMEIATKKPKLKVAVVVGHNEENQGYFSTILGKTEYELMTEVAEEMYHPLIDFKIFYRKPSSTYPKEIKEVYNRVDDWGADLSIELHFNAFDSKSNRIGHGTETLSSGSVKSLILAECLQNSMIDVLKLKDRGVKVVTKRHRGGKSLHYGKAPAALIEPFFGDEKEDVEAFEKVGVSGLAESLVEAVLDYKQKVNHSGKV